MKKLIILLGLVVFIGGCCTNTFSKRCPRSKPAPAKCDTKDCKK